MYEIDEEVLIEILKSNLEHARHVENERITLNSIFTAIVAGVLAFTLDINAPIAGIVSTLLLLLACTLAMLLNKRWNDVFDGHMGVAKKLYSKLFKADPTKNEYYYMSHTPNLGRHIAPMRKLLKIRTRDLFTYFYNVIFIALLGLLGFYIWLAFFAQLPA